VIRLYLVTVSVMGALALCGAACDTGETITDGTGSLGRVHGCNLLLEAGPEVGALAERFAEVTGHSLDRVRGVLAERDAYCGPKEEQDRWCFDRHRADGDSIACSTYRIDTGPRAWIDEAHESADLLVHEDTHLLAWVLDRDPDYDHERDDIW